jgi:hypothetical protein
MKKSIGFSFFFSLPSIGSRLRRNPLEEQAQFRCKRQAFIARLAQSHGSPKSVRKTSKSFDPMTSLSSKS